MNRRPFLLFALFIILAGLLLRLVPWGLPLFVHHYGGGILWGAMVFMLLAAVRPLNWGRLALILAASVLVVAVELVRLYHSPALDHFRTTLAGQLFLGHIFAPWNILAYELGIAAAVALTWRIPLGLAAAPRI